MKTKTNKMKLKELLQPKEYKSDIKLFCKSISFKGFLTTFNKKKDVN